MGKARKRGLSLLLTWAIGICGTAHAAAPGFPANVDVSGSPAATTGFAGLLDDRNYFDSAGTAALQEVAFNNVGRPATWTIAADAVLLTRNSTQSVRLVETQSGSTELLNARDLDFNWAAGPRVSLMRSGELFDVEIAHFSVASWQASGSAFAPPIIQFPGNLNASNDNVVLGNGAFRFDASTSLYNTEFNLGKRLTPNLRGLVGFRWVELHDRLEGGFLFGGPLIPFMDLNTYNRLYGGQAGLDVTLWQSARWELSSTIKGGVYADYATVRADRGTVVELKTEKTAFVGDLGFNSKFRLTQRCAVRLGYQMLWIGGLALAPKQIDTVYYIPPPSSTAATGSSLFAHGVSVGLEASF